MLVRALTGHWLVGAHAGRLKAPKNDFCRSCRNEEEKTALCRLRIKHLGNPFTDDLTEISGINFKNK